MPRFQRLQVTAAPTVTALVTLDDVKTELKLTATADDAWLTDQITRQSSLISGHCNRVFGRSSVVETFRFGPPWHDFSAERGPDEIVLRRYPLISIDSLTEIWPSASLTLTENTDFEADYESGRLLRLTPLATARHWPLATEIVAYQAGYELPGDDAAPAGTLPLPGDLAEACIRLVALRWFARTRDPLLRSEEDQGAIRKEYWTGGQSGTAGLPTDIAATLDRYRIVSV